MDVQPAIKLIKEFEGFEAHAYPDPATGGAPWTIGYGSTRLHGRPVRPGDTITEPDAAALLRADVQSRLEALQRIVTVPLSSNETCALLSFCYNVGLANLKASTLLKLLNSGAPRAQVAAQFGRWNRAAGKVMNGLTRRRAAEAQLFLQA